jgi:DNA-binding transcriptional ArsR family regulator
VDLVFKALADPSRRALLDSLYARDGQTLGELTATLEMTRFGAMKHLQTLENANLITTRKIGREKLHYLNPVPIQQIHARWVSKYAEPSLRAISAIKTELEAEVRRPAAERAQVKRRSR